MTDVTAGVRVFANLGCGYPGAGRVPAFFGDWQELRVDADAAVQPDLVADLTNLTAIRSGTINAVWASHCIEHLYLHDVATALAEIHRILTPDGFAVLLVPDIQTVAQHIVDDKILEPLYESPAGPIAPYDILFGFGREIAKGRTFMAHRSGFTPTVLGQCLAGAGFGGFVLFRRPNFELAGVARKAGWRTPEERDALLKALAI
jgi:SAM-dependent methyltransferase